ncbi:hypothetical protein SAMD00019534_060810 [Acytostelium subglobosum LB1]|uniref:hypothetical protein n=1 Tax=Acytostelium subglobosum LB1 TaxID=1410327 RepID=UPI000644AE5F|nr:hypothetical protein SAMD00019534_060810 [Acytostelium subglobosum LB1]GAM22906.1 hypothetical protein SAMD00019534_060810 [Acytostelium subglobosum LB1]|eukprot:XP_012754133.1 hypothetical protein SAMD00019534_060810 [Acytostelium subglobosum LB1]
MSLEHGYTTLITNSNFDIELVNLEKALHNASFVSIDTEFSGVGYHKGLKLSNIQDRYSFISKLVKSRSLLQLGIAVFTETKEQSSATISTSASNDDTLNGNKKRPLDTGTTTSSSSDASTSSSSSSHNYHYDVRIFSFLLLNQSEFQVYPASMTFLVQHGFDFNKLFTDGIPFTPFTSFSSSHSTSTVSNKKANNNGHGNNNNKNTAVAPKESKQHRLIEVLSKHRQPVVIHNGLFDILFLYQSFIGDLPDTLNEFIVKFTNVFPKVYDTKYISEYKVNENRSFLQYLFLKYERNNYQRVQSKQSYLSCDKVIGSLDGVRSEPLVNILRSNAKSYDGSKICPDFANHGYCKNGIGCTLSHDVQIVLDEDEFRRASASQAKAAKKMRKDNNNDNTITNKPVTSTTTTSTTPTLAPMSLSTEMDNLPFKLNQDSTSMITSSLTSTSTTTTTTTTSILSPNNNEPLLLSSNLMDVTLSADTASDSNAHSAGYDSAMTGFIFAYYKHLVFRSEKLPELENKIYLTGKEVPLLLKKSSYA